ncbi:MAG: GAF domain-containing protein [Bryobacteraceae bacterium]|nr:GAF domain-containing protein [Bryobacteraceae bacterium]
MPYLWWLRLGVTILVIVRLFYLEKENFRWLEAVSICVIFAAFQLFLWVAIRAEKKERGHGLPGAGGALRTLWQCAAFVDAALISGVYWLTQHVNSDVYLLYALPILVAAEYMRVWTVLLLNLVWIPGWMYFAMSFIQSYTRVGAEHVQMWFYWRCGYMVCLTLLATVLTRLQQIERKQLKHSREQVAGIHQFQYDADRAGGEEEVMSLLVEKARRLEGVTRTGLWPRPIESGNMVPIPLDGTGWLEDGELDAWRKLSAEVMASGKPARNGRLLVAPVRHGALCFGTLLAVFSTVVEIGEAEQDYLVSLCSIAGSVLARGSRLNLIGEIGRLTAHMQQCDEEVEAILANLTGPMGFDFATVSAVDRNRGVIEMVRARNVAKGWLKRCRYHLDAEAPDILADVANRGVTEVLEVEDKRLNPTVYSRYGHARLARIWTPIRHGGQIIGVLETGRDKNQVPPTFSKEQVQEVEARASQIAAALEGGRPVRLLERAATHAARIIGADGAAIHIFGKDKEILLEAGCGLADPAFVRAFEPAARDAMQARQAATRWSGPFATGEILCAEPFSLNLGGGHLGVLHVFFRGGHELTSQERELENGLTAVISVAIRNHQLLEDGAEARDLAWRLASLQQLLESLASSAPLENLLQEITYRTQALFDADNVVLHQYDHARNRFVSRPVTSGHFEDEATVKAPFGRDALPWEILRGETRFLGPGDLQAWTAPRTDRGRFAVRENVQSCAALVLRSGDKEPTGVLFINYRERHEFPRSEQEAMKALAASASVAITSARLRDRAEQSLRVRGATQQALLEVDREILNNFGNVDYQMVLQRIMEQAASATGAATGAVMWLQSGGSTLGPVCSFGVVDHLPSAQHKDHGIVGRAARLRITQRIPNVGDDRQYVEWTHDTKSEMAVPIWDEDRTWGVLNLEHPAEDHFTDEHQVMAETLALQAAIATRSAESGRDMNSLRALSDVAASVQLAGGTLDGVLRMVLTGVTAREGLGFTRAAFFVLDRETGKLRGRLAVGPINAEEALCNWSGFGLAPNTEEKRRRALKRLLYLAAHSPGALTELNRRVREVSLLLADHEVLRSAIQGDPVIISPGHPAWEFSDGSTQAVLVPCRLPDDSPAGILIADRAFQPDTTQTESDLPMITLFAELAGAALQKQLTWEQLSEQERAAEILPFLSDLMHRLHHRTAPVRASLSRFWREVEALPGGRALEAQFQQIETRMSDWDELIERLHRLSRPRGEFETKDFVRLIQTSVDEAALECEGCQVRFTPPRFRVHVPCDEDAVVEAVIELIRNGAESAFHHPNPAVRVEVGLDQEDGIQIVNLEVTDNGDGIRSEAFCRLFEANYTTKEKGRGLGLFFVRKTVKSHGGDIEAANQPGGGARFRIRMPAASGAAMGAAGSGP